MNIVNAIKNAAYNVQIEVAARHLRAAETAARKLEAVEILQRTRELHDASDMRRAKLEATRSAIKQIRDIWIGRATAKSDSTPVM